MVKELGHILRLKLEALPFADLVAGVAQTVIKDVVTADDTTNKVTIKMPVSDDTNSTDACLGLPEVSLIPNSARSSIMFFEDFGTTQTGNKHNLIQFNSSLRLLCWLNRANLVGNSYTMISGQAIAMIIDKLRSVNPENVDIFTTLKVAVARIPPQDAALFGRYTYKETDRQYLRPPFEFFGIDFSCTYFVNPSCLPTIQWTNKACY